MKKIFFIILFLCLIALGGLINYGFKNHKPTSVSLVIENKKATSGYNYTIFYKNNLLIDVSLKRPDKNDKNILICIPAAYTDLQSYFVDGLYIDNGKVYNKNKVNHSLGGAIKIINGNCEIFPTQKGKLLNDSLINLIVSKKGSLFQQIQIVEKGVGAKYKDTKLFQRRAIVKLKGNKTAIIESYEHITLTAFTKDLLELGAVDALYTDMGAWDEGWYRQDNKLITIGRMKSQTDKQCNWVVFKEK
ncbi:MAG: hypothetical protein IPH89_08640 [Bacteroidetes bacterium]|nr:hypothetical protein [Bacteroidota bacterium]